jgi:hypothetical protein
MLKESIKSPIFTGGFRLIDLLCQSYPPHCVVLRLELSEWLWKKSHREQPIVRLAMCERSSLGLPHTQNRMSGRPRVAEILLMRSPKTLRVCVFITAGPSTKMFTWGGRGYGRTCATRDDEPRPVGTLEEPGTLTQGAPVFPGSSRLGIEPKTPGWLVQAQPPAHRGI